jgi:hypothetical protein
VLESALYQTLIGIEPAEGWGMVASEEKRAWCRAGGVAGIAIFSTD